MNCTLVPSAAQRALLAAILLISTQWAQAQTSASVHGAVQSAADEPLEYATVTLHRATDSMVVKTEFSDAKGLFHFEQAPVGRYLVSAAQVGFGRQWSKPFEVAGTSVALLPLVLPANAATQLKDVTVVGKKPLYEREADRTIVNVEGSTLAAGNTSLDVLRRSPGVTVDNNDNLALRGKQGVLVLIDGKRQPMTGTELADYLRALPAEQLQSIELITNPPAKYDAQGGAGIIAINLKKDQRLGTNGSLNLAYSYSPYDKYTAGFSLNHRRQGLNLFGSYNYADRTGLNQLTIHRDFFTEMGSGRQLTGLTDQDNRLPFHNRSHSGKAGLDYTVSKRTTVGVVASGLSNHNVADGTNTSVLQDVVRGTTDAYNSTNDRDGRSSSAAANLNLRHVYDDATGGPELTADLDYANYRLNRTQRLQTYAPDGQYLGLTSSNQQGRLSIQSAKADYSQPLGKEARLEAGAKASLVKADNDLQFFNDSQLDLNRSNRFRYDENVNAAYLTLTRTRPSLTLTAGLRAEQTNAVGRQDREVEFRDFTRHYFQLFPSAAIKRKFSEQHETSLSLSRRIDRPSYSQLNPFREIIDKTTSGGGNPTLLPQTSYNLELAHTFRQKYSLGVSYSLTSRPLISVVQPETDSTVLSTTRNLDRQHYLAVTLTAPVNVAKWWAMYNNAVLSYNYFTGELVGTDLNRGGVSLQLTSNHTFTFGKSWSAELNGTYQSRQVYAFLVQRPTGEVSAGIQKSFWDRRGTLKLSVADIFYTQKVRATSTYDNYLENFYQRRDSRVANLAFTFRFGNDKVAPTRRRQTGAEDEKRRAG